METWQQSSQLSGGNAAYVESLFEDYLKSPQSVSEEWQGYFSALPAAGDGVEDVCHSEVVRYFEELGRHEDTRHISSQMSAENALALIEYERKQVRVLALIASYRNRGHQKARLDPLGLMEREEVPDLELAFHQLSSADLEIEFQTGSLFFGRERASLREIIEGLEQTYCQDVGPEIMHITDLAEKRWLQERFESARSSPEYPHALKKYLLERLTAAEGLERHLDSKYPGTKRFGLEGGESLIPLLNECIHRSGTFGAKEIVLGMAHRGRLNALVNIWGKNPADLFEEFEGKKSLQTSGDVKYHQGFSSNVMTGGGEVHLAMAFNPSHLEIVAPVVEGSVRARQDRRRDPSGEKVVPILVHGDAAFAGQGVVMETFQMSQTRGYKTGGTIHVIINNQVGFTISRQDDARSTEYCTDIAKMVQAPIFHVNGDDPEAVLFVTQIAVDYRYQFKKDVVIDLVCYRRRGHNETDEPSGTQPLMYKKIKKHPTTRTLYAQQLVDQAVMTEEEVEHMATEYRRLLDEGKHVARALVSEPDTSLFVDWAPYLGHDWNTQGDTGYLQRALVRLGHECCRMPEGFQLQRQVNRLYQDRVRMMDGEIPLNWGMAELLAYATLLEQGYQVRLTGQDVGRGTFSHRHAVVHCQQSGTAYVPLQHLSEQQPSFDIYDSFLSEEAVLGFEYGYATTAPKALIVWEAQFGDFANGAQVVIDQFLASGEQKWARLCGLTLLLPHGYEGQGPEHSSARLERFLQLCAQHNMQVCVPTTPAQIFHLLRRQAIRPLRRPLVVMSPKSLLRHPLVNSSLLELAEGSFLNVIPDVQVDLSRVKRLIFCSGKVYYHLFEEREKRKIDDIALIRIEQLYPFPEQELLEVLKTYQASLDERFVHEIYWCQEEPMNQGAWYSIQHHIRRVLNEWSGARNSHLYLEYVGREASASPAAGYASMHEEEQKAFIDRALTIGQKDFF
jgi:2-oxoglutarate dehydrogenase E1 component